ncbi:uncharacterized protein LOC110105047 isoform X1 [Dendrobium catenatum]|uniref:Uncharacterized protein n=1 Tax=Dendrobium catenatum TaxID=906689 RepID=A0A2I0WV17_9ASPA|nr:uncharacterized protein LOC110105047 isoform X1 [Dendrobium catenatum]XP_020690071.2 uncharacterized protein LOC110105047 isoform X1 [Dendrobium catenatum]XP_020690078.2 uncharacterized protein LOC110105047 isoform X1 [Dendrobium catenatum]XP_028551125.1 uncharacterized protein LOC110105047 isoform X1 [Dendrobium catenatum]PKU79508.1 hypothetical protein MA16_Dca000854 [Dendrobium catenatum]
MHVSTALQGRSGQGKFQREGAIPDNLSLMQRGLANFGSQEGNSPGYVSGFPGSLEKPDVTASPVSFDFLGGHQQLGGQHSGMSQPHQMHQQGPNDTQWKQHLIAMQMQEIQRQQQFQQLHLGARQHNPFNQMFGATGQGAADELPGMLSGMPVANAVNYMPADLMGSQSKSTNNSHLFIAGNMNWAQRSIPMMQGIPNGLIYSQDQGQLMHSMGFVPRTLDQSLHGTPVSGNMGSLNHYFQLQGMPNDSTSVDLMSKLGENHAERTSVQSSGLNDFHNDQRPISNEGYSGASFVGGRQGAQEKTLFGNALVQGADSGSVSGSIHQSNHLSERVQVQEFQDGRAQTDWLGKSHNSITAQVAPSHMATSLDPTEEKILFGVDDNANWDAPLGVSSSKVAGTYLNGYPMQNNDCLNVFPSLQSGTWSALVQEALEVSSSDTGQQEEWSGLSLQKVEPQAGNHLVLLSDNDKQNVARDAENNLHDTLRSKHFPLLNDTTARHCLNSVPSSQQPIKYSYEQNERLETDHSIRSVQQLSKKTSDAQFAQNYQPYNFIGNSFQERQRQLNASNDVWVVQEHQQAMQQMDSSEMGSNSQGIQHSWIQQQKMPFYNMNSQLGNKISSWGIESPSSSGSRNFKNDDNGDLNQYARSNDINTTMNIEMGHARNLGMFGESKDAVSLSSVGGPESVKSETNNQKMAREHSYVANLADFMNPSTFRSNTVINQQLQNRQTGHPFKHIAGPLFMKDKEANQVNDQKQLSACTQDWDPTPGHTNKESGEAHGHAFSHLNTSHETGDGRNENERDDSLLARSDHLHLISGGQKFSDQSDRKSLGSQRFQFHPMGNLEINVETANQESHKSQSQGPAHPMMWGLKNQEKENFGNSQLVGHVASTNSTDIGKDCFIDPKKNSTLAESPHTGTFSGHNPAIQSFSATTARFSQEKRIGLPSQNVHMLFDKSDQSDDCSSTAKQNNFENNSSSGMPEGVASDGPISHVQRIQANHLHGIGLKLAHPPQRQSVVGNPLLMRAPAEGTPQTWSSSPSSSVSLPTIHETNRRENLDYKTSMSPQNMKDALYSNTKGNSLGMITNIRNQPVVQQQQLQQQSISYASRQAQFDLSVNQSFGSKVNADGHPKHIHLPQPQDPHDRSLANQTSQALFPGMPGKVSASRFASFPDNGSPLPSHLYSQQSGDSDMINASSDRRNVNQLLQVVETVSANLPSAASVESQQGHFSNFFNNAWRNAATQRPSGLQSQKIPSNLLQSLNPLRPPHQDDQCANMGGNASSEVGACSFNSQQFTYGEENPLKGTNSEQNHAMGVDLSPKVANTSEVQEQESKNISNKSSAVSICSSDGFNQQDDKKGREKVTFPTVLPSSNDVQTHSYSLLQQMQAMKGTDSDQSKIVNMRLKGSESACRGSDAGAQPSDMKILSFSSREIEERSGNSSNHLVIGELASRKPTSSTVLPELQNGSLSSSVLNLTGTNARHLVNPQMVPSWFEQYGNYKDCQTSGLSDSLGSSQRSTKAGAQHYFYAKASEQMDNDAMMKRRCDSISENSSPSAVAADSHSSPHLKVPDESLVLVRKKRKIASSDLHSWHKEVTQNSRSLQSFSLAKMEWAQATNRLIEKIEDDVEAMDDVTSITRPKRRLVLTTQLIQQLFPPVPAKFLFQDSVMSYEKVIYYLTRLTLGEACSLISVLGNDSGLQLESRNTIPEKNDTPKKKREEFFLNIVDNFILRLRRLQSNFLRLEGGSTVVDFRMECQDVERGSIINRFAKFHGRGPVDGIDGSSASETTPRRSFPQRNVSVLPMPRNLPDGVICLSL